MQKDVGCANNVSDFININVHTERYYFPAWETCVCLLLDLLTRLPRESFVDKLSFFDSVQFDECVTQLDV